MAVTLTARILQKQRDRLLLLLGVQGAVVPAMFSRNVDKIVVINLMAVITEESPIGPILRRSALQGGPSGRRTLFVTILTV